MYQGWHSLGVVAHLHSSSVSMGVDSGTKLQSRLCDLGNVTNFPTSRFPHL